MMLVSQDGQKAIDSADGFFGTLILYRHKDRTVVMREMQQVLRFVADETLYVGGDGHDG